MGVVVKPPSPVIAPVLEWRANRIEDPVERLRFLKTATARVSTPIIPAKSWKRWTLPVYAPALLWLWMLVPQPGPSTDSSVLALRMVTPKSSPASPVWIVEETKTFEIFSNGLRVEKTFQTRNRPRNAYTVFRREDAIRMGASEDSAQTRSDPVGIVFHSTESHQVPFEPAETRNLKRIGRYLLEFVEQKRAYHYVIDRFGRVFRVVQETDAANHAGKSVWADDKGSYVNLNDSFLGIAIEAQGDGGSAIGAAQLHAARVLTEMLRAKYRIAASNCVTHAQVSVNPSNWKIGYHTDWASGFPFAALGLPDNYRLPLGSIVDFGFDYDDSFLNAAGDRRWPGLLASTEIVRDQSRAAKVNVAEYQRRLQKRFEKVNAAMRERGEEQ
jgi:hypothetical protein